MVAAAYGILSAPRITPWRRSSTFASSRFTPLIAPRISAIDDEPPAELPIRERFHRLAAVRFHRCVLPQLLLRLCRSFGGVVVVSCGCGVGGACWLGLVGGCMVDGGRVLLR